MVVYIYTIHLSDCGCRVVFIDEAHFKAAITVSLTTNLVMYTLNRSVQENLPDDSSLKLIDIWLLHGLLVPMIVFIILTTNHLLETNKLEEKPKLMRNIKVGNSNVEVAFADESKPPKTVRFYMMLCKAVVPLTTIILITTFVL